MTSQQALELLDKAVASLNLNRQSHAQLIEALKVIQGELSAKEEDKKETHPA